MRALYKNQQKRYQEQWYKARGEQPPNIEFRSNKTKKTAPDVAITTETCVLKGNKIETATDHEEEECEDIGIEEISYWEGYGAGIEPIEFRTARSVLMSDSIISRTDYPKVGSGHINECFTPYENDCMSFEAFEISRRELQRRSNQLADEMKRVDDMFNREPVENWFALKGKQFTIEHCRYLDLQRRRAAKKEFL